MQNSKTKSTDPTAGAIFPRVEFHGWGLENRLRSIGGLLLDDNIDGPMDVTHLVRNVSWTRSTRPPYETIKLSLAVPFAHLQRVIPGAAISRTESGTVRIPGPGFWVVIRSRHDGSREQKGYSEWPAVAWGRCTQIQVKASTQGRHDGHLSTQEVSIQCSSWVDMLSNSRFLLSPDKDVSLSGFIWSLKDWGPAMKRLLESIGEDAPGRAFEHLWPRLTPHLLPTTLVQAEEGFEFRAALDRQVSVDAAPFALGSNIPLVWNRGTCAHYAPLRVRQHLRVPGMNLRALQNFTPRGDTWSFFRASFQADPRVVEMFPSLEFPSFLNAKVGEVYGEDGEDSEGKQSSGGQRVPITTLSNGAVHPDRLTGAARGLGSQPVLIYRLLPCLMEAVTKEALQRKVLERAQRVGGEVPNAPIPQAEKAAQKSGRTTTFGQEPVIVQDTCDTGWHYWVEHDITDLAMAWDDSTRVNGTYAKSIFQTQDQFQMYGISGLPTLLSRDVYKHGLRIHDVDWPFIQKEEGKEEDFAQQFSAFAEMFHMMIGNTSEGFFGTCQMTGQYRPWVGPGYWHSGASPYHTGLRERDGMTPLGWTGYGHTVTHSISVDETRQGAKVRASTTVQMDRWQMDGAWSVNYPMPARHFTQAASSAIDQALPTQRIGDPLGLDQENERRKREAKTNPDRFNYLERETRGESE